MTVKHRYIYIYRSTHALWVSSLLCVSWNISNISQWHTMTVNDFHQVSCPGLNIMDILEKVLQNDYKMMTNDDRKFWWVMVGETNSGSHWHSVSPTRLQLGSAQIWVAPLPNQIDGGSKFKCFVILILTSIAVLSLHNPHSMSQLGNLSKMFLQIFSVKGGWGTPPFR